MYYMYESLKVALISVLHRGELLLQYLGRAKRKRHLISQSTKAISSWCGQTFRHQNP